MRSKAIKLLAFRRELKDRLALTEDEDAENTSLVLAAHALKKAKTWLLAHGDYELKQEEINTLQNYVKQYLQGVPLPYIIGSWEFFNHTFKVTPDVLIPRPETELLVERAIAFGQEKDSLTLVDVGTGSGIIAISLAASLSHASVYALDISIAALAVAKENAGIHQQNRIKFVQSDLLSPFRGKFDLICANLPYIPSQKMEKLPVARWEPRLALDGGPSGLESIEKLLFQAKSRLSSRACILFEIESSLGNQALEIAHLTFPGAKHHLIQDLAGHDRVLQILLP
ncbi:MAG: peptide chain release factor N(5)-glutamine methyltransferase [Brevefilum sp.]|nr:peptide chain release factor N(5)-glutamine methyltransferase [Brevefilum sp.]MDW7755216.1 peptide chain release factor N(5)-glutamine methyltransferase [Brevefilum sp.]